MPKFTRIPNEYCGQCGMFRVKHNFKGMWICDKCLCPDETEEERKERYSSVSFKNDADCQSYPSTFDYGDYSKIIKKAKEVNKHRGPRRGECETCSIEEMCGRRTNNKEDGTCESYIRKIKGKDE